LIKKLFSNRQIFHCCVQKTASQWFKYILGLEDVLDAAKLSAFYPYCESFDRSDNIFTSKSYSPFPKNTLISPLYIDYKTFSNLPKPKDYRAFFVTRDPRDILVSWYFSAKFSHGKDGYINQYITDLQKIDSVEEGLIYSIQALDEFGLWRTIKNWHSHANNEREIIVRFEDLTGGEQVKHWQSLFEFLDIELPSSSLESILSQYNFEYWSKGRKQGEEDKASHMRKGISGDWKNYFTPLVAEKFQQVVSSFPNYHQAHQSLG